MGKGGEAGQSGVQMSDESRDKAKPNFFASFSRSSAYFGITPDPFVDVRTEYMHGETDLGKNSNQSTCL